MAPTIPGSTGYQVPRLNIRSMLLFRRDEDEDCENGTRDSNFCEKPMSTTTIAIVVGIV